ncbi:MAG: hypothetical protein WBR15_06045 [Gammaproteobacteria bacterium]
MQHTTVKVLTAFLLGALLAGGISFAIAEPFNTNNNSHGTMPDRGAFMHRFHGGWGGHRNGPTAAAIADLNGIQRLYMMEGRRKDVADLYKYVLSKTQNPELRNYAYGHLARAEIQVTNADQAIATLRQSLDENLTRLNNAANTKQ